MCHNTMGWKYLTEPPRKPDQQRLLQAALELSFQRDPWKQKLYIRENICTFSYGTVQEYYSLFQ